MATMVTGTSAAPAPVDPPPPAAPRGPLLGRIPGLLVRYRLLAVCLGFLVLSFLQQPGKILGDTKLDLVVDPVGFLGRALTLWEPQGSAGQLQNQAYGYFFPMGPFFALGDVVGLPAWVVQRLWFTLLLSAAFLGVVVLARLLRIGTPGTALVAGIAYALAPRMVTALGATSVELIPMALAPWVIIPLAAAAGHGSARRAAALSGLAVFCVGGVNAVATAAVLPLAVLFLLTRPAGPFRRRLVAWWVVAVGLATAWWAGPLLLLGRYSPPFLDYIENASNTTSPTDVLSVLRGTSHWIATLYSSSGPTWPAGWALVHDVLPAAGTVLLATAGLVALCRRDLPERVWLVLGVLAGVGLVSLGHLDEVQGAWAGLLNEALDGPLAPLRNVHKFDPVLRLPLVLGLAHLGAVLLARAARGAAEPAGQRVGWSRSARAIASRVVLAVLAVALVATVSPALDGRLTPPTGFEEVPEHWREAAAFLAAEQPSGRALLVPGSSFPTYRWGAPTDEPMQPLAESPWEVRNSIPLTPEAHIRALDAVEDRLALGQGSAGLTRFLARSGISHLVLRNDLDTGAARSTRPVLVREALRESPGITPVATFGPVIAAEALEDGLVYDAGLDEPAPAVEVYAVEDPAPRAWTTPLSTAVTVHGGPEGVLALEDRDVVTGRPTVMAGATAVPTDLLMVSDAQVRRERNFGRLNGATSAALSAEDPLRLDGPSRDYQVAATAEASESLVQYVGGVPSASSSASDPDGFSRTRPDTQPWSAVDGDLMTAWRPAPWAATTDPPWWRLTTDRQFFARDVVLTLGQDPGTQRPRELRLTTDAGEITVPVADTGEEQVLPLPEGYTATLTISSTVPEDGEDGVALALADVRIPGVAVSRSTVTPRPARSADVYAFDATNGRSGCVLDSAGTPRCAPGLFVGAEETRFVDRTFSNTSWLSLDVYVSAVARPGAALDELLGRIRGTAQATSGDSLVSDPRGSPAAAVDGDPATAWMAEGGDLRPTLSLSWPEPRTVDSLRVVTASGRPAAVPTAVTVAGGGTSASGELAADGTVRFPPMVTDRLEITFEVPGDLEYLDPYTGWTPPLGMALSELEVGGPNPTVPPETPVDLDCGTGPTVQLDGVVLETAVRTTVAALENLQPVPVEICDIESTVTVPTGVHRLLGESSQVMTIEGVTLTDSVPVPREGGAPVVEPGIREAADIREWGAEHRTLEVGARDEQTLLVVPENVNTGWRAQLDGRPLDVVTVDGWQQGYVLPPGAAGEVRLDFAPGAYYRTALAVGAGAVLLLLLVAVLPARPSRATPRHRRGVVTAAAAVLGAVALVAVAGFGMALVGGVVGLTALAGLWLAAQVAGERRTAVLGAVTVTALLSAGTMMLLEIDGTDAARQGLAIVALAAVVAGVLPVAHRARRVVTVSDDS